jgi:hypothetical protein
MVRTPYFASVCSVFALALGGCYTGVGDRSLAGDSDSQGMGEDSAGGDGDGSSSEPARTAAEPRAAISGLRRLTAYEYENTVRALLGAAPDAALNLPADARAPFDNDYAAQVVSQALIEGAELLAGDASVALLKNAEQRELVLGCTPEHATDEACFRQFIEGFGRRALRRPLSPVEVEGRMSLLQYAAEGDDFYVAVDLALRSFLQDPAFLYRVEVGEPIAPAVWKLDDWEVATRLSYLIWASTPDDGLLDLAAKGQLRERDDVRTTALAMLDDPRALQQIERFHALWMGYEGLVAGGELGDAMHAETSALFERIVSGGLPWRMLFAIDETFVSDSLAEYYGLEQPEGGPTWVPYGDSGRAGLLSHGSFLAVGAQGEVTSPTERGRLVRELLLCQTIPPPPDEVVPTLPSSEDAPCKTDRYAAHIQGGCAGCHDQMDGIGFGLESYDGLGRFVEFEPDDEATPNVDESQCALASEGQLLLAETHAFSGPGELGLLLADSPELPSCMMRQFYRFASGRSELDDFDERVVDALIRRVGTSDFHFSDVIVELVSQPEFLLRREPAEEG